MADKFKKYTGKDIDVEFSATRCIHAARCVHGLPEVFNPDGKPWIKPDGAKAEKLAEVVRQCPTGALRYKRHDGGAEEAPDARNSITLAANGPANARGEIELSGNKETRVSLCRCGASHNKPLCDGSHEEIKFKDDGGANLPEVAGMLLGAKTLKITPLPNGPLKVNGVVTIHNATGKSVHLSEECYLCRCGASQKKPFCDGAHAKAGFKA